MSIISIKYISNLITTMKLHTICIQNQYVNGLCCISLGWNSKVCYMNGISNGNFFMFSDTDLLQYSILNEMSVFSDIQYDKN